LSSLAYSKGRSNAIKFIHSDHVPTATFITLSAVSSFVDIAVDTSSQIANIRHVIRHIANDVDMYLRYLIVWPLSYHRQTHRKDP